MNRYFIGNRALGGFVLAMTTIATYGSVSSFVGGPGQAWSIGFGWVYMAVVQVTALVLLYGIFGKKMALVGRKLGGGQQTIVLELFGGLTSSHGMQLTRGGRALMILAGPMMTLLLGIISLWLTWNIVAPVMTSYNLNFWDLAISPFTAALISPKLYILSCLIMIGEWWTILNLLPIYPLDGGQLIAQYIRSPRKVFMTGFITAILIGLLSFQLFHGYFIPIFMALFAYSNYREYKNAPF